MKIVDTMKPKKILSQHQIDFIENNYLTMSDKEIGKEIGLSEIFLASYRSKNKMHKIKKPVPSIKTKEKYFAY